MPSAIELSVRFGLPTKKIEEICDFLDVDLNENDFDTDKEFEKICRSVKRKRTSAGTMALLYASATLEQREFVLALDPEFAVDYHLCNFPIADHELFEDAKRRIDRLADDALGTRSDWLQFAEWVKTTVSNASGPVTHNYLATRLLLSLPGKDISSYPGKVASLLNKARHRGYLNEWFETRENNKKNFIVYREPIEVREEISETINLTDAELDAFADQLGSRDAVKLAGFIAFQRGLDFATVKEFLEKRNPTFDL